MDQSVDIAVFARNLNQASPPVGSALVPVLICRVEWQEPSNEWLFVTSGKKPADGVIDTSASWSMASDIDLSEPSTGGVSEVAMNPFGATVLQQRSIGSILQIPTKGWNELKLRFKSTGASPDVTPDRVLALSKLR